jgi:glyoxylase-like metal-dependent hydrolase (beta-lactamase superfamily II)
MEHVYSKRYEPVVITPNFFRIGTPSYPAYLSLGDAGMIIEGGTGGTFPILVEQITELGIKPERIKYLALTHTHPDHIGAVPNLKKMWPHLQIVAGTVGDKTLENEEAAKEFLRVNAIITENMLVKGEITGWPPEIENAVIKPDMIVKEGDKIDLGSGVTWTVYDTPGHSPCHVSYYNAKEQIVTIGDATGLYDPAQQIFWPNYWAGLETYCDSIRKLAALPAQVGVLCHNHTVKGDVRGFYVQAMKSTEAFHNDMLRKVAAGADPKQVTLDTAKWVYTFTNNQPFEVIFGLSRLMLKRSQTAAGKEGLFNI